MGPRPTCGGRRARDVLPHTTGVEATPRTTGVDVMPGGAMIAAGVQAALSPVPRYTPLREAIALAVEAQTGASPATAQTKARAAMLLLSIDESTVVLGGE